ncbi:hypothetical protein Vadar_012514 [Vaccinium darrowii]|uniref:Uncharacterized protein n=1 Tax=Vaccinium darrowii TaxID=229202 RepID=A0ACB7X0P1_9ERIC|nr:hypothetical protein Vadar_012514 [Vaccinium darrowii]
MERIQGRVQVDTLLKHIIPQVDIGRATQLNTLFSNLQKKAINIENFIRLAKDIVGNQLIAEAVEKMQIQKKRTEEFVTPSQHSSKRQKLSELVYDQSFEQFNDVTAISGINLWEEEENLLSGRQEGCQVSKSSPRVVRAGKEGTLILQKSPLQEKLTKITSMYGITSVSKDVERCLSLFLEERMRGMISKLMRISKQRVDFENRRQKTLVTSDIRHQLEGINNIVEEEWGKRQAEESEVRNQVGGNVEENADCSETAQAKKVKSKVNDILRTAVVNAAARAAAGGVDLTSKWRLMADKALNKHDGRKGAIFKAQTMKLTDGRETKLKGTAGTFEGDQFHSISGKDIIAVLERDPQMSKSTFSYRLYERLDSKTAAMLI